MTAQEIPNLASTDEEIARWIWANLVPKSGQASSVQGELLRAVERLRWEAQGNGNINWDEGFARFVAFLAAHLLGEREFTRELKASLAVDLERLSNFLPVLELERDADAGKLPYVEDDLYDRLVSHIVRFCRLHPRLIPHRHDPDQHR